MTRYDNYGFDFTAFIRKLILSITGAGGTTESTVTTGSSATKTCPTGKYWWVFEYVKINGKQQHDKTSIRVQFALEDKEDGIVEIHTIDANTTVKTVKVTNTTKQDFDRVQHNSYQYIYIGKIREGKSF